MRFRFGLDGGGGGGGGGGAGATGSVIGADSSEIRRPKGLQTPSTNGVIWPT